MCALIIESTFNFHPVVKLRGIMALYHSFRQRVGLGWEVPGGEGEGAQRA